MSLTQNTRFTVAIHILMSLALRDEWLNSGQLAWSIDTNPSMVRRILATLLKAGLVQTRAGIDGGAHLAAAPEEIRLIEVFDAVAVKSSLNVHEPNEQCPLGAVIQGSLKKIVREYDEAARDALAKATIATVAEEVRQLIIDNQARR